MAERIAPMDLGLGAELDICLGLPLFAGPAADELVLTSDEWAAARQWVRRTGRPIRLKPMAARRQEAGDAA